MQKRSLPNIFETTIRFHRGKRKWRIRVVHNCPDHEIDVGQLFLKWKATIPVTKALYDITFARWVRSEYPEILFLTHYEFYSTYEEISQVLQRNLF